MTLLQHAPRLGIVDFGVWDALRNVILLLLVALLCGTIAERRRQSVIVGYLIAGADGRGRTLNRRPLFSAHQVTRSCLCIELYIAPEARI